MLHIPLYKAGILAEYGRLIPRTSKAVLIVFALRKRRHDFRRVSIRDYLYSRVHSTAGTGAWASMSNDVETLLIVNLSNSECTFEVLEL